MLRLPPMTVARPTGLAEALSVLAATPAARVLAGGTDLVVALKQGHVDSSGSVQLVSLADVGLSGLYGESGHYRLGATSTLWDLARWQPPRTHQALRIIPEAAHQIAAPPIRSRATLGGNLCLDTRCFFFNQSAFWRSGRPACRKAGGEICHAVPGAQRCFACHQADLAPVLIALGATVTLESSSGARDLPLEEVYSGAGERPLTLAAGELLTRVTVPFPPSEAGAGWEKIRMRKGLDFAVASAAVYLEAGEAGRCREARVVLGALGSGPIRVSGAEEALRGTQLDRAALEAAGEASRLAARPVKNTDLTPAYRRQVASVAVTRAARKAWEMAGATRGHIDPVELA